MVKLRYEKAWNQRDVKRLDKLERQLKVCGAYQHAVESLTPYSLLESSLLNGWTIQSPQKLAMRQTSRTLIR